MSHKFYEVYRVQKIIASVLVKATSRAEALELAEDYNRDIFNDAKDEVTDCIYSASVLKERPQGRIINTKDGYLDATDQHHQTIFTEENHD